MICMDTCSHHCVSSAIQTAQRGSASQLGSVIEKRIVASGVDLVRPDDPLLASTFPPFARVSLGIEGLKGCRGRSRIQV